MSCKHNKSVEFGENFASVWSQMAYKHHMYNIVANALNVEDIHTMPIL